MSFKVSKFPPKRESPLHNFSLESALEEGLGLSKTKTGSDDKELGYIIRQNFFLRLFLGFIVAITIFFGFGIFYFTNFNILQFDFLSQEVLHRRSEHSAQTKLLDAQLELKTALETVLHQTHRTEEFRSYLEKTLGDNTNHLKDALSSQGHLSQEFINEIVDKNDVIGSKVVHTLDEIVKQFEKENRNAVDLLKRTSDEIIDNIKEDQLELDMYKDKLSQFGIRDKNSLSAFIKKVKKSGGKTWSSLYNEVEAEENISQKKIEDKLKAFFASLELLKFPATLANDQTIAGWEKYLKEIIQTLKDQEVEVDIMKLITRTNDMMMKDTNGQVDLFDPANEKSIVDYMKTKINEAKLAPHREEMLDLYRNWKEGGIRTMEAYVRVEQMFKEHIDLWLSVGQQSLEKFSKTL